MGLVPELNVNYDQVVQVGVVGPHYGKDLRHVVEVSIYSSLPQPLNVSANALT